MDKTPSFPTGTPPRILYASSPHIFKKTLLAGGGVAVRAGLDHVVVVVVVPQGSNLLRGPRQSATGGMARTGGERSPPRLSLQLGDIWKETLLQGEEI